MKQPNKANQIKKEDKKAKWLEAYRKFGTKANANRATRTGRTTEFEWERDDPDFKAAVLEAEQDAVESMEQEADRRAVKGTRKPVYYKGKRVGYVLEYSDTLLMFRLKALAPEKYRDNVKQEISTPPGQPFELKNDLSTLSTKLLMEIQKELENK